MEARIKNPAALLPETRKAVNLIYKEAHSAGVDPEILELVHLRASQINGCSVCVDIAMRQGRKGGMNEEKLFMTSAWRETPYYSEPERAALALAEAATRLADRPDPVPDEIWDAAAKHFDDKQLAAIVLWIATSNFFNRLNATTRQQAPVDFS